MIRYGQRTDPPLGVGLDQLGHGVVVRPGHHRGAAELLNLGQVRHELREVWATSSKGPPWVR